MTEDESANALGFRPTPRAAKPPRDVWRPGCLSQVFELWHLLTGAEQRLQPMEQKNTELFFCLSAQQGGAEAPGRTPTETHTHTHDVHQDEWLMGNEEEKTHLHTAALFQAGRRVRQDETQWMLGYGKHGSMKTFNHQEVYVSGPQTDPGASRGLLNAASASRRSSSTHSSQSKKTLARKSRAVFIRPDNV